MLADRSVPIHVKMYLFRAYLKSMELLVVQEADECRERMKMLHAEATGIRKEIEALETAEASKTEEEIDAEWEAALEAWENSWMHGDPSHLYELEGSSSDDYYSSPHWDLELANVALMEQQMEVEITQYFPNILRRSLFVNLFSFLESTLVQECHRLEPKDSNALRLRDIAGRGVQRAVTYLTKVKGVRPPPKDSPQWQAILDHQKLRNCIVHNQGRVNARTQNRAYLRQLVEREEGLSLSGDEVILGAEYCLRAIAAVESFLVSVLQAIREPPSGSSDIRDEETPGAN